MIEQIINNLDDAHSAFFYRTHQGTECDLLLEKGGKVKAAIEIKFSSSPVITKGFLQAIEGTKAEKGYIIAPVTESFHISKNILVINLRNFIESYIAI